MSLVTGLYRGGKIVPDRAVILHEYLKACRQTNFRPGRHDCALFAADWVEQLTGIDLADGFRGYSSIEMGREMLRVCGYSGPVDIAETHLEELSGWMAAQVGDVAVVIDHNVFCLGVVGGGIIHMLAVRGLDQVPLDRAVRVFRP